MTDPSDRRPSPRPREPQHANASWWRRRREAPHEPFFRDARTKVLRVRFDMSLRVLLVAVVAFVILISLGAIWLINQNQKILDLRQSGHDDRIHSENEIRDQIRANACFQWNAYIASSNPDLHKIAGLIDNKYHCSIIVKPPKPPASSPSSRPSTSAASSAISLPTIGVLTPSVPVASQTPPVPSRTPHASATSSTSRASRSPSPSTTVTVTHTRPAPSRTPTPSPTSTGLLNLGPILCTLHLISC